MFTSVTIQDANGVDVALFDSNRRLGECRGLHGLPSLRRITRPRPGGHGEINTTRHYGSRQPVWTGILRGTSEPALWAEYDTILAALWGAVDDPRLLKWTRADGLALQSLVKIGDAFDPVITATDAGRILRYQLTFDREDPRNYSQTEQVIVGAALTSAAGGLTFPADFNWTFTPSGAGTATVVNTGTIPAPGIFRVYGAVTSPQVLHVETDLRIAFDGAVSAGSYLEIDVQNRAVLLNGSTDRTNLVDFAATDWQAGEIPVGTNNYRLIASTFDASARLDVFYRSSYS